jgi:hypothetical protein
VLQARFFFSSTIFTGGTPQDLGILGNLPSKLIQQKNQNKYYFYHDCIVSAERQSGHGFALADSESRVRIPCRTLQLYFGFAVFCPKITTLGTEVEPATSRDSCRAPHHQTKACYCVVLGCIAYLTMFGHLNSNPSPLYYHSNI